jgi:hypothetical protein
MHGGWILQDGRLLMVRGEGGRREGRERGGVKLTLKGNGSHSNHFSHILFLFD